MIFYFSSTGNSRWAAETIGALTGDKVMNIAEMLHGTERVITLEEGEKLGFVFPVHGWRVPGIVREFVSEMEFRNVTPDTYIFALATAGDSVGECMTLFRNHLSLKGLQLHAAYSIVMPESYIGLPFMYLDKPAMERRKRLQAEALLKQYAEHINNSDDCEHLQKGAFPRLYSGLFGDFFYGVCVTDKHFHVDSNKCVGCGLCERLCPVGDIAMTEAGLPQWKGSQKCMTCYSCLHHCPQNAITWGWFTKGKGQYLFK